MNASDKAAAIEEVWQLAYKTFENRPAAGVRPGLALGPQSNEVQFRMMKQVAKLNHARTAAQAEAAVQAITGDVLVCEAMGWMTPDISERMQTLLSNITEE